MIEMQVSFRVSATSLAGIQAARDLSLAAFFGETEYTYVMQYIQGENEYDLEGKPVSYSGDVLASFTVEDV